MHSPAADSAKVRAAAYCRVSTDREDQINSVEAQRAFFSAYIKEHENWISAGIFADEGLSGTSTARRTAFNRMLCLARAGEIDLILTKEVSRFARNTVDTLTIIRELKTIGVGVIFLNDGIDTRENDGEFRLTIMASVAQEESRKISERTRWGQVQALKKGVVFGNNSIYGYTLCGGELRIDPEQARVVRQIFHCFLEERKGTHTIARELSEAGIATPKRKGFVWSSTTVLRILKNEKYTGDLLQQKFRTTDYLSHRKVQNNGEVPQFFIRDHHEAVITREVFDQVQAELARRHTLLVDKRRFSSRYWYSGKIICGNCGSGFTVKRTRRNGKEYARLLCRGRTSASHGGSCSIKSVSLRMVETCALHVLQQLPLEREKMIHDLLNEYLIPQQNREASESDVERLRHAIQHQEERRSRALEAFLDGMISKEDWLQNAKRCDEELARLRLLLDGRNTLPVPLERTAEKYDAVRTMLNEELNGGPAVLDEIIDKIVICHDHFEVTVEELPVCFRVQAEGRGAGPSYRVEVTECVVIPKQNHLPPDEVHRE